MEEPATPQCSLDSISRGEPQAGSAPVAATWLLIEHPGPWAPSITDTAPFTSGVGQRLEALVGAAGGSLLLVRRASSGHWVPGDEYTWRAFDTVRGVATGGTWRDAAELIDIASGLDEALAAGEAPDEPTVAVCTHGVRDVCCATRGRPLARSLTERFGASVWECSHLGGHRFAPTMLVLPSGACYGRLDAQDAVRVVEGERSGLVAGEHLRGVTRFEPPVQAAVAALLARHGPAPLSDLTLASTQADAEATLVEFAGRNTLPTRATVSVVSQDQPLRPLGCGAKPKGSTVYRASIIDSE